MLTPEYLQHVPDAMLRLYGEVEEAILADMARRINGFNLFIPSAQHQMQKLEELGALRADILTKLGRVAGKSQEELASMMQVAGMEALRADDEIYLAVRLKPSPLRTAPAMQKILAAGVQKTGGLFENLTRTTANTATKQFEKALDKAYMMVTSGAFSPGVAMQSAIKQLAKEGIAAIEYPPKVPGGPRHTDSIEVAVRRAVITGVNQTCGKLQEARADEMGVDLVKTTAHAGARPSHALWQGRVFSRSGKSTKHPDFRSSTGYGTGAGLMGWNCSHSFFPYIEGMPRAHSKELLQSYEAKQYSYNGMEMTEYEAIQQQRAIERNLRRWKREHIAMQAAGLDTAQSASKIKQWQDTQKDFLSQTGLKRQTEREKVMGGTKPLAHVEKNQYNEKKRLGRRMGKEELFEKIENTVSYSAEYKQRMKESYLYYREHGFEFREHAINRVLGQKSGKEKFYFSQEKLLEVLQKPVNYRQADGKRIRFYEGIAVVAAPDTAEIVSIIVKSHARKDWEAL